MDISILLNKTVTNLWAKTQVQQIKTITGASQALVGRAALPWGLRGGREPGSDLSPQLGGWVLRPQGSIWALPGGQGPQRLQLQVEGGGKVRTRDRPQKLPPLQLPPDLLGPDGPWETQTRVKRRLSLAEGKTSF